VKCEAWIGGRRVASDLPVISATVAGDASNFVRRSASLSFADDSTNGLESLAKVLALPGCEVRAWSGARVEGRDLLLPVHWGMAENPKWSWPDRTITLTSQDMAIRVAMDRFTKPRRSTRGFTVAQQIGALVRESLGTTTRFADQSGDSTAVADVVWDRDRNDAVTQLAASIGCETFWRPDGVWVLRRVSSVIGVAAHRVREGVSLVDASVETDWSSVRNHWVATAERADGTALFGEDFDNDPVSPTYVFGPMGRRTGFYASSLFTTSGQCVTAARALRYRSQGARVSVGYTGLAHPGVESGDRHNVVVDGTTRRLLLDSFSLDLFAATMTGQARLASNIDVTEGAE
jgi:hypothetical protein